MANFAFMVHEPGQAAPRRVPVEPGLTLGRHPQCGCVLQDGTVSGHHARVGGRPDALVIEDLGGTNPTHVNGQALQRGQSVPIPAGSTVVMGQTRIDVVAERGSSADTLVGGAPTLVGGSAGGDATVIAGGAAGAPPPAAGAPPPPPPPPPPAAAPPPPPPAAPPPPAPAPPPAAAPPPPVPAPPPAAAPPPPPVAPAAPPVPQSAPPGEPTPQPVPAAQVPANQVLGGDEGMATLVYGDDSKFDPSDPHQVLALQASLSVARPRLVFANEADRRIVDVVGAAFVVGRSSEAGCTVPHPGVSSKHARIVFKKDRFFLEDLGGRNKTFVNKRQLAPEAAEELTPEAHVSFGPVDALFVVDTDPDGHRIPADKYRCTLDVLVKEGLVQPQQRSTAEAQAAAQNRHVGEVLLLSDVITIKQWKDAFKQGEVLFLTKGPKITDTKLPDKKLLMIGGAVVVVLIVVLALVF